MKAIVEENGLLIPRELLGDAREVEIVRRGDELIVGPIVEKTETEQKDGELSIWNLGNILAEGGAKDGSTHHDRYVSGV